MLLIQDGIGEKIGSCIQYLTVFVAGFSLGFIYSWKMTLVILSITPLLIACGAFIGKIVSSIATRGQEIYAKAGGIAEEVISCMRTVVAFGGENTEIARYLDRVAAAQKEGEKSAHVVGAGLGVTFFIMFASYGLAFWYGSKLIEAGEMEAGDVTTVFFAIIMGAMSLGQAGPLLADFGKARGAAVHVFEVIDRIPLIDALSDEGVTPVQFKGEISLRDVKFTYPTRPDAPVLKGINLDIIPGKTIALVGSSGCGKSTVISLIQRFYDVESGSLTVDGRPIKEFSVKWLRSQIGVVSQEPILFAKSIRDNIALGREGVTQQEIEAAAKQANAHSFISRLPQGYDTLVEERGAQLSGGQKQRVAIARAIIRDPRILLLDEATSALDAESEKLVQEALEVAARGRTTIIIAHRLSTIKNADMICVFDQGVIAERGQHDELMGLQGIYFRLVERQAMHTEVETADANASDEKATESKRPTLTRSATAAGDNSQAGGVELEGLDSNKVSTDGIAWRTLKLISPEWYTLLPGLFGAIGAGLMFPLFSLIFSQMLTDLLFLTGADLIYASKYWAVAFLILATFAGVCKYLQVAAFAVTGERLTERMRVMLFRSIVRQDIAFFDDKAHSTGTLTTLLANDATLIKGAAGPMIGSVIQILSTITGALVISLTACWQLALAIASVVPIIAIFTAIRSKIAFGHVVQLKKAYEDSGHTASEAIENTRPVSSLCRQETFMTDYSEALGLPEQQGKKNSWVSGLTFGFSEMMTFLIWAFAFWYGSELVIEGKTDFAGMMRSISAIVFGATSLCQAMSHAPDYAKAKLAAASLFQLVDRVPLIDSSSPEGARPTTVRGDIEFKNIKFSYPTRPNVKVLRDLTLSVQSGETLALVGSSGCGKSTVVSLLERFYAPESGTILLDGIDISMLHLPWLRSQIGIVGQEPILFATSIRENIAYGKPGATEEEIVEAAKKANAHSFITTLPDGYDTLAGEKGSQLSGGQKQRVAIARALIRNPKILLLDEATSALDAESEKIVQEALDKAREGRTTIVIAHRLSTIQNASAIAVVDHGKIVEMGTHQELMAKHGFYHNLVQTQVNPM